MDFTAMKTAWKRANSFALGIAEGEFSIIKSNKKPCIAANNYQLLLDSKEDENNENNEDNSFIADIAILHMWAESLNRYIDENYVKNDIDLHFCLAAWKSRMFFDPSRI